MQKLKKATKAFVDSGRTVEVEWKPFQNNPLIDENGTEFAGYCQRRLDSLDPGCLKSEGRDMRRVSQPRMRPYHIVQYCASKAIKCIDRLNALMVRDCRGCVHWSSKCQKQIQKQQRVTCPLKTLLCREVKKLCPLKKLLCGDEKKPQAVEQDSRVEPCRLKAFLCGNEKKPQAVEQDISTEPCRLKANLCGEEKPQVEQEDSMDR